MIHTVVDIQRYLLQLLRHFLLRLSGDAALDLLACTGVEALRVAALPVGVGFSVPCCCDFSDGTGAAGSFSCFCTRHIRSFPPRGMYHLHDISRAAVVQVLFLRRRDLLPQELQQGISRNTNLPTDTDATYLAAADQLIGGVHAEALVDTQPGVASQIQGEDVILVIVVMFRWAHFTRWQGGPFPAYLRRNDRLPQAESLGAACFPRSACVSVSLYLCQVSTLRYGGL